MTDHTVYRDLLAMRHDLAPEEETTLSSHLQSCPECRALEEEYARQDAFLQALRLPEPPQTLQAGVLGKAHARRRPSRWPLWQHGLALLSAAAVLLFLVFALENTTGNSRSADRAAIQGVLHAPAHRQTRSPVHSSPYFGPQVPAGPALPPTAIAGATPPPRQGGASDASFQRSGKTDASAYGTASVNSAAARAGASLSIGQSPAVTSRSKGLQLSLSLPRSSWPARAVVPVRITVRNVSTHYVYIVGSGSEYASCPAGVPGVQVIDAHGSPVSPIPIAREPLPSCPAPFVRSKSTSLLKPGASRSAMVYAVLQTRRVRAVASVIVYAGQCDPRTHSSCSGREVRVTGRPMTVRLVTEPLPRVSLRVSPTVSLTVSPAPARNARLWWDGWFSCGGNPQVTAGPLNIANGRFLAPNAVRFPSVACNPQRLELHLVAGWVGHPATRVEYVRK